MSCENPDPSEIDRHSLFLSEITGMSIIDSQMFSELNALGTNFVPSDRVPFTYKLTLKNGADQYALDFCVTFTDEWTPGEWLPDTSWHVYFNNEEIFSQGGMVNTSSELRKRDFQDIQKVTSLITSELMHAIGGPDTTVAFMDYENYSLESLKREDSYFNNIYLAVMIHMKERGCIMPPILSEREYIRKPMKVGDTTKVDQILASIMIFEGNEFPNYARAHMRYEMDVIRRHALWEAKKRDLNVPLQEAFPYSKIHSINEGEAMFPPYTILVVENDLTNYGGFSSVVIHGLEKDGRFKGSQIVTEVNLPDCMDICASGRIDMVLFDWSNPSYEEALMVKPEDPNPFYQMLHGDAQAALQIDEDGIRISTPDGKLFDPDELKKEAEKLDIRNKWMNMIKRACEASGIIVPPSFIVRSRAEFQDISKIVSQKLGQSIS